MTGDQLGDVRRHAVHDRIGDENPAEIVRDQAKRLAGSVGEPGGGQHQVQELADGRGADLPVLQADALLEQDRHGRAVDPFVVVVGDRQRHCPGVVADPADDRGQHVGQLGADHQQPLGVGLGRDDVQQRDQLTGAGKPVLDQAVVGQLGQLLHPHPGHAQHFHRGPGPECMAFLAGEVAPRAACGVLGPHAGHVRAGGDGAAQRLPGGGEHGSGNGGLRRSEAFGGGLALAAGRGDQRWEDGQPLAGPLVHAGLAAVGDLLVRDLPGLDRAGHGPRSPPGRVVHRPLGDVKVEAAHRGQAVGGALPGAGDLGQAAVGLPPPDGLGQHPLFPSGRGLGSRRSELIPG